MADSMMWSVVNYDRGSCVTMKEKIQKSTLLWKGHFPVS